jgi:hypothetical protein
MRKHSVPFTIADMYMKIGLQDHAPSHNQEIEMKKLRTLILSACQAYMTAFFWDIINTKIILVVITIKWSFELFIHIPRETVYFATLAFRY